MKTIFSKREIGIASGILVLGVILGWLIFGRAGGTADPGTSADQHTSESSHQETYTCSMHPQIKQDHPGNCPICGMELIPIDNGSDDDETLSMSEIKMSKAAMKIAEVQTTVIGKKAPYKEVYFPGKIAADERLVISQSAHIPGRIERMYVNFTGETVHKGQKLISIYSPELITAQKELFEAEKSKDAYPAFLRAAKEKLKLWKLTDAQIAQIEASGQVQTDFDILADYDGVITKRMISLGDHLQEGSVMFHITDLSHVWVMFEAYESDIPWVKIGDRIRFTVRSIPSKIFNSTVTFIDPVVDPVKRVAYVRTELDNKAELLKPGMFTSGILKAMLPNIKNAITVPKSAILWTGKRAIVYVKVPNKEMVFEHREIVLGEDAGPYYVVMSGLKEGEVVATNGVFKIDAAAQLLGKESMMTPAGGKAITGMAGMPGMGGDSKKKDMKMDMPMPKKKKMKAENISAAFKKQLGAIVTEYLAMKDAFVIDDAAKANNAAKRMRSAIGKVDMKLLTDNDHHMAWTDASKMMKAQLDKVIGETDIEKQRTAFSRIGDDLTEAVRTLGVDMDGKPLYIEFCPMANDNEGGYWLSFDKNILNPYLGQKMLKCGSVKETLNTK